MRAQVAEYIEETPWAILPSRLRQWVAALASEEPNEQIRARFDAGARSAVPTASGVGVVPIIGPLSQRTTLMEALFGVGTSMNAIGAQIKSYVVDPTVKAIVLDIDSPGGTVAGSQELAQLVLDAREVKPVIAVANSLMASAAYWIGSAASEVVSTPSALVGSIGVIAVHMDESKALEMLGVKATLITAGKYKGEMDPTQPLTDEAKSRMQDMVDQAYGAFINSVARGRGVSSADVRTNYGQGRLLTSREALTAGMVDRIGTLEETLGRVLGPRRGAGARALEETPPIMTEAVAPDTGAREARERRLRLARAR